MTSEMAIEGYELSPQQKRVWRAAGGAEAAGWTASAVVRVRGAASAEAIERAAALVVERHEILRTAFRRLPGLDVPAQIVHRSLPPLVAIVRRADAADAVDELARADAEGPFDLVAGPALRVTILVDEGDVVHAVLLAAPSLCADALSMHNVASELVRLVSGASDGDGDEPVQYARFAEWQRDLLAEDEDGHAFWAARMPMLEAQRGVVGRDGSVRGDDRAIAIDLTAVERPLAELARRTGLGRASLLHAAWCALAARLTEYGEVVVGVAVDGRSLDALRPAVGLYERRLPVATDVVAESTLLGLAHRVEAATRDAVEWQEYFTLEGSETAAPQVFELGFAWRELAEAVGAGGMRVEPRCARARIERHAISLEIRASGQAISAELAYDTNRCDEDEARRLARRFERLLASALASPDVPIAALDLLPDDERELVLSAWNRTDAELDDASLLDRFHRAVDRHPDAPAVLALDRDSLSFADLDALANRVAARVRDLALAPESPVAVLLDRSPLAIAAFLAAWKADLPFLPLDPDAPPLRLASLLRLARVRVLLSSDAILGSLDPAVLAGLHIVSLDDPDLARCSPARPLGLPHPDSLAYVLFTSGSSGLPKPVAVSHRALANLRFALHAALYASLPPRPLRVAVNAPFVFDAFVKQFVQLADGHALCLLPEHLRLDPVAFASALADLRVDVLDVTPPHLSILLDDLLASPHPPVALLLGGDRVGPDLWRRLGGLPDLRAFNLYGPTECTVDTTVRPILGPAERLGAPLPNVRAFVVDPRLDPLPLGLPGELVVAGAGLARGYLHRPDLTADAFRPDPFATVPGQRLYRTGDLARALPSAELVSLGRRDLQVKLRGHRVELAEIDATLAGHPAVRAAVTLARPTSPERPGDLRLVAYVTGDVAAAELRAYVAERLPAHMVPDTYVALDRLPLTRNGKVDRDALPEPSAEHARDAEPRTQLEATIAGIWCDVLGASRVGLESDFFGLGGHSLVATRLVSRVREACGVEVPLATVFERPTLGAFAEAVEREMRETRDLAAPPVVPVGRDLPLPLSFAQQRLWFLHQLDPGSASYNSPAAARIAGRLDVAAFERAWTEIVRRHEILRTVFVDGVDGPTQRIEPVHPFPVAHVDLTALDAPTRETEARRHADEEARRPFDLARGPLLRVTLLRLGDEDHVALATMHHVVSDGWSTGLLMRELSTLYTAFAKGEPSPLPDLPVQYADFATWQRAWLSGPTLERLLDYWRARLAGAPPLIALPTDRPRPPVASLRGARTSFALSPETTEGLRALGRGESATIFMTLLAAYAVLLGRLAKSDDVVVGTDVASRTRRETEGLVGFFVNVLPMRVDLAGDQTFRELLRTVRASALDALARQDTPFDKLVEALQPARSLAHHPIFQALFVLQNAPRGTLDASELDLRPFGTNSESSKFDVALFAADRGDRITAAWDYATDLFDPSTIETWSRRFATLLDEIVASPDAPIRSLRVTTDEEVRREMDEATQRARTDRGRFLRAAPKAVALDAQTLVTFDDDAPSGGLPAVARPAADDVDLPEWIAANRDLVRDRLHAHGGILFRGFGVGSVEEFERFASAVCPDLFGEYGDLPREGVSGKVYGATPYPADKAILFHNESSHLDHWPLRIFFHCVVPATDGGATPIVDCRRMLGRLDPSIRERLAARKLRYVRNYVEGLDVAWRDFFRTSDRAEVEARCRRSGTEFEWRGDDLRTYTIRPAIARHVRTGVETFFNQIQLHHISCVDPATRASLVTLFGEDSLPRNVTYGDGAPIEDSVVDEISGLYEELAVDVAWQPGDFVALDNMLTAHGRRPYSGARRVVVALGDIVDARTIEEGGDR